MIWLDYFAPILQNCRRLLLLPCKWTLGLSIRMAHQPSGAVFERPRDSGVKECKGFDPPNASPAQSRVPLGAMSPNTPARSRRRWAEQTLAESTRKRVRYSEQSRVQEVVEERQRAEKARAQQQARTQQQTPAQEIRNSQRRQQRFERQAALAAYEMEQQQQQQQQASRAAGYHVPPKAHVGCCHNTFGAAVPLTLRQLDVL